MSVALLASVPGIGRVLAERLHDELGFETLAISRPPHTTAASTQSPVSARSDRQVLAIRWPERFSEPMRDSPQQLGHPRLIALTAGVQSAGPPHAARATGEQRLANGPAFIRWFGDIGLNDVSLVGGKNASLGELYRELSRVGVRVPNGFAIAAEGYRHFMHVTGLAGTIDSLTKGLQPSDLAALAERGLAIRQAVLGTALPDDLQAAITDAYQRLGEGAPIDVAVRSSATAEDLPDASFAAVTASG